MNAAKTSKGFTIVELLIVVVIIAILAAVTIVAYNGIAARTNQAAKQNNLQQVSSQILNYKTVNGTYPTSLSLLNDGNGVKTGTNAQYAYTSTGTSYCLTVGSPPSTEMYYISDTTGKIQSGACPGHTLSSFSGYPGRLGTSDITFSYGSGDTILAPIGSIPVDAWMIVILTYTNATNPTPPAGWTALETQKTTNTLQTSIYAKIKQSGDAASQEFESPGTNGRLSVNAALLWGENSAPVGSWIMGSFGDRSVTGTSTTTVTPTITTTTAKTLVLSISTERTNVDETLYTSLTGVTPWFWVGQPTGDTLKNQTIAIGYTEQAAAGVSQAMTVTYPNSQVTNGTAVQIGIPPAP